MGMRVSLAFFCTCSHLFHFFHMISLFFPLFPLFHLFSFSPFFCTFSHLFHLFSHYFPLFHIISLFFHRFSLFFSHSFSHFRWPGRGRSLAALPCLPLPYLTLPLLSSPSLTLFKKKEHRDFQQISVLRRSSCSGWFQGLSICLVVDVGCKLSFQMYHVCEVCVWSKHAPKSVQFFWNRCRSSTLMSKVVIKLCVYAGTLERCRVRFFGFLGKTGGGLFFFFLLSP